MPNWCINTLDITDGSVEEIENFFGDNGKNFTFQAIEPCPKALLDVAAAGHLPYQIMYTDQWKTIATYTWITNHVGDKKPTRQRVLSAFAKHRKIKVKEAKAIALEAKERLDRYGHLDWYSWRIKHWGTKWDACDVEYEPGSGSWRFDTAWSPPLAVVRSLAEIFPNHVFTLEYEEPGMAFMGRFSAQGDWVLEDHCEDMPEDDDEMID